MMGVEWQEELRGSIELRKEAALVGLYLLLGEPCMSNKAGAKLLAIKETGSCARMEGGRGWEAEAGKDKAATQLHEDVQEMAPAQGDIEGSQKRKYGNSRPLATNLPQWKRRLMQRKIGDLALLRTRAMTKARSLSGRARETSQID